MVTQRGPLALAANRTVLKAFGRYYYLSGSQVRDLLYDRTSDASRKYALERCKELTDGGLLIAANSYDRGAVAGSDPWVWSRTEKGRNALERMGYPNPVGRAEAPEAKSRHAPHLRLTNDTLIDFERFGRETPGVSLLKQYHELELRADPVGGKVLDSYVAYHVEKYQAPVGIGLEADCGTERRYPGPTGAASIDEGVRRLLSLASGPHVEAFGIQSLRFAWVIRSTQKAHADRLRDLLHWTEEAITKYANAEWANAFRFTIADPTAMSPYDFVTGNHWVRPFQYEYVPLVAL